MDEILLQVILALAMFATTAIAGLVPLKLLRLIQSNGEGQGRKASWILTLLSCFAGGVFMGTCFLDIFPHVNANYARFLETNKIDISYPFPEFFTCCGFFLVYFLEEISLKVFSASSHHGHSHGENRSATENNAHSNAENPLKNAASQGQVSEANGHLPSDDNESDNCIVVKTHEIVMENSVRYVSSDTAEGGILKSITFAIAMSFHSILEGFALGVQDDTTGIMTLFISLIIHKGIEAFSVGLQVSKSNSKRIFMVTLTILIYALMTPLGSMIGAFIMKANINPTVKDAVIVVLEGFAGGTFVYVTFFEVLAQERANDHSNLIQLNAIVLGFLVIAGLQVHEHFGSGEAGHHGH